MVPASVEVELGRLVMESTDEEWDEEQRVRKNELGRGEWRRAELGNVKLRMVKLRDIRLRGVELRNIRLRLHVCAL